MEQMGLVRCGEDGCGVYLDPVNVPGRRCMAHRRRKPKPALAEVRFAPDQRKRRKR